MTDSDKARRFFDIQVNGYFGSDFNDPELSEDSLLATINALAADGVEGILATVITASDASMLACMSNLIRMRESLGDDAQRVISGIHIEGPFISPVPGYVGAHPAEHVWPADQDYMRRLIDAGQGLIRLVTLAPEQDADGQLTRWLTDQGICVAAGHCDPSLDQLSRSIDCGLRMFTHLGNGCPALINRHDNIVGRVLSLSDQLIISFIADGFHVPLFALKNYLRCVPPKNLVFTTDAIAAAGLGAGEYTLGGRRVRVRAGQPPTSSDGSHFVGSSARMPEMYDRLQTQLGLDENQLRYSMYELPKRIAGLEQL